MKKIIRLNESELIGLIKTIIKESDELTPEDYENIENDCKKAFENIENEKSEISSFIERIKEVMEKEDSDDTIISAFEKLLKEKEERLQYLSGLTYENLFDNYKLEYERRKRYANAYKEYELEKAEKLKSGITKERLIDSFVGSLEGGSNYWYLIKHLPKEVEYEVKTNGKPLSEAIGEHVLNGGYIIFHDVEDEDEELGYVDMDKLLEAITLMKKDYPEVYERIVTEEDDAGDSDVFLQLAVMGDVVFG